MFRLFRKIKEWFSFHKQDTELEVESGRCLIRGGIERYSRYLWDSSSKLASMDRVLRKRSRDEEAERVRVQSERARTRSSELKRIYESDGFKHEIHELQTIENACYWSLRHPESRKANISFEFYNGYLNGQLSVIEHLRSMYERSIAEAKRGEGLEEAKGS